MSYKLADYKWGAGTLGFEGGTIKWHGDLDDLDHGSQHSDAEFDEALRKAFDAWEDVADLNFQEVSSPAQADVVVDTEDLDGGVLGTATVRYASRPGVDEIREADIDFDDSGRTWAPEGDGGSDFFAVALHEIGHALGLEHVNDETEIMNPFLVGDEMGDGDAAGAVAMYGAAQSNNEGPPSGGGGGDAPPVGGSGDDTPAPAPAPPSGDAPAPAPAPPDGDAPAPAPAPEAGGDDDGGGGIFDMLFGWIFELFSGLFGGGGDDEAEVSEAAETLHVHSHAFYEDADTMAQFEGDHGHDHDHGHGHDHDHGHHGHDHGEPSLDELIPMLPGHGHEPDHFDFGGDHAADCDGCCGGACGGSEQDHVFDFL